MWWLHNAVTLSRVSELYTFKWLTLCYVNVTLFFFSTRVHVNYSRYIKFTKELVVTSTINQIEVTGTGFTSPCGATRNSDETD